MRRNLPQWRRGVLGVLVLLIGGWIACGGKKSGSVSPPVEVTQGSTEQGIASWYGHPYHGRRTANGEVYDMEKSTAAHKTLPFDTWVKVTNLSNGRSTRVRINDRGPFIEGRIIDLSRKAAREIGMLRSGISRVRVEIVSAPARQDVARYTVQVGSFRDKNNADRLLSALRQSFPDVFIQQSGPYFRVRVGRLAKMEEAERLAQRLRRQPRVEGAVVVRL